MAKPKPNTKPNAESSNEKKTKIVAEGSVLKKARSAFNFEDVEYMTGMAIILTSEQALDFKERGLIY